VNVHPPSQPGREIGHQHGQVGFSVGVDACMTCCNGPWGVGDVRSAWRVHRQFAFDCARTITRHSPSRFRPRHPLDRE